MRLWGLFGVLTLAGLVWFGSTVAWGGARHLLLIGKTTSGHHQIELACDSCHTSWFGGKEAIEEGCKTCHAEDLKEANDNHPAIKFRDPRNADRLEQINVTQCLTCHVEHNEDVTSHMGVTVPMDYCIACHAEIGEERETHKDLEFTSCATGGCHNYHDNRALYEDFLAKHIGEPDIAANPVVELAAYLERSETADADAPPPAKAHDAPAEVAFDAELGAHWLASAHAQAGVNCSGCHQPEGVSGAAASSASEWIEAPGMAQCASCHAQEAATFVKGKHGMRLADGMLTQKAGPFTSEKVLSPMQPEWARLPMHADAAGAQLTCNTCHDAHSADTVQAEVNACVSCHADDHTQAYFESPHHDLWLAEQAGTAPVGSGVSCATCHMPRELHKTPMGEEFVAVQHNQNDNLRPNEKMGRNVCLNCHGLSFTLDALADDALVDRNFNGRPQTHIEGIDWVEARKRARDAEANAQSSP